LIMLSQVSARAWARFVTIVANALGLGVMGDREEP
jgi:hypothetical protein